MAVWTDPAGHVWTTGELVTAANENTYIANDLINLNSYAEGTLYFDDSLSGGAATTATTFATHGAIATFGEAFTMIVKALGWFVTSGATTLTWKIQDQGSALDISYGWGLQAGQFLYTTTGASTNIPFSFVGKKQYAANASAGYRLQYATSAGTVTAEYAVEVTFVRGAV